MDPNLELSLSTLARDQVRDALGSELTAAQIDALLLRRGRILEMCGASGG